MGLNRNGRFGAAAALAALVAACTPGGNLPDVPLAAEAEQRAALRKQAYLSNIAMQFGEAEDYYTDLRAASLSRERALTDSGEDGIIQPVWQILNKSNQGFSDLAFEEIIALLAAAPEYDKRYYGHVWLAVAQDRMNARSYNEAYQAAQRAVEIFAVRAAAEGGSVDLTPLEGLEFTRTVLTDDQARFLNTQEISGRRGLNINTSAPGTRDLIFAQLAHAQYVSGRALLALGDTAAAETTLASAGAVIDQIDQPSFVAWLEANILLFQGETARIIGQEQAARDLLTRALATSPDAGQVVADALLQLRAADNLLVIGADAQARKAYRSGVAILEELDASTTYERLRGYLTLLTLDHQAGPTPEIEQALFAAFQRVETPATAETITETIARITVGDGEVAQTMRQVQDLKRVVRRFDAQLDTLSRQATVDRNLLQVITAQRNESRALLATAQERLEEIAPYVARLSGLTVSLDQLREVINDDETVVMFVFGPENGMGLAISETAVVPYEIALTEAELDRNVEAIRLFGEHKKIEDLAGPGDLQTGLRRSVVEAHAFERQLFGPAGAVTGNAGHLIIQPAAALLRMPFTLLPMSDAIDTAAVAERDYRSIDWLGKNKANSISLPIGAMVRSRLTPPARASRRFVGFADYQTHPTPDVANLPPTLTCQQELAVKLFLEDGGEGLPGTAQEMKIILEKLALDKNSALERDLFTDDRIIASELGEYQILHFATHAVLDEPSSKCPPQPALITSLPPNSPEPGGSVAGDGLLDTSEILDLKLNADLVVLSACDTGQGQVRGQGNTGLRATGEGFDGLARAFFGAGARSLMVSHWPIGDQPTRDLMGRFYGEIGQNDRSIAYGLLEAQRWMLEKNFRSRPAYWASFVVVGDGAQTINDGSL